MNLITSVMNRFFCFYYDGFRSMSWWGKRVWVIILIKLFIIFLILKIFFFQDFLQKKLGTEEEKRRYVLDQLINSK